LWWLIDELGRRDFVIDENFLLDLHVRLMNGILTDAGRFRRHSARITGSRVTVANYSRIADLLQKLHTEVQRPDESLVAFLARQHAEFERLHPFSYGNGRVGRQLMLAIALSNKMIPPIIDRERRAVYYKALQQAQLDDDPSARTTHRRIRVVRSQ
jgi:Fic family protein